MKIVLIALSFSVQAFAGGMSSGGDGNLSKQGLNCYSVAKVEGTEQSKYQARTQVMFGYTEKQVLHLSGSTAIDAPKFSSDQEVEGIVLFSSLENTFQIVLEGQSSVLVVNLSPKKDDKAEKIYFSGQLSTQAFAPTRLLLEPVRCYPSIKKT
ncbi:MAG: hypothetical protein A4S09_02245 [Proteobacteria bacterium SG_bin7]|nr:MAG: hypothetical protein A4S09_02245 [Proteobacteria bacterium SG_bin7]